MKTWTLLAAMTLLVMACDPSTSTSDAAAPSDASPARDGGSDAASRDAGVDGWEAIDVGADALDAGSDAWMRPVYCGNPRDCAAGQICGAAGLCTPGPCSATNACIFGYACQPDGTCGSTIPGACVSRADCTSGSACLAGADGRGGVCTPSSNQCIDCTQCNADERCADGACVLACTSDAACRDGFTCDTALGLCTHATASCTITDDCASATRVCVDGACVPRSSGATCAALGDVWKANGCVPEQSAHFACANDGVQDACAAGSICLHHSCWISCDAPHQSACASMTVLNTCKLLQEAGTTYAVCATSQNLGGQCGAGAAGATCSGAMVCVDGYCLAP